MRPTRLSPGWGERRAVDIIPATTGSGKLAVVPSDVFVVAPGVRTPPRGGVRTILLLEALRGDFGDIADICGLDPLGTLLLERQPQVGALLCAFIYYPVMMFACVAAARSRTADLVGVFGPGFGVRICARLCTNSLRTTEGSAAVPESINAAFAVYITITCCYLRRDVLDHLEFSQPDAPGIRKHARRVGALLRVASSIRHAYGRASIITTSIRYVFGRAERRIASRIRHAYGRAIIITTDIRRVRGRTNLRDAVAVGRVYGRASIITTSIRHGAVRRASLRGTPRRRGRSRRHINVGIGREITLLVVARNPNDARIVVYHGR